MRKMNSVFSHLSVILSMILIVFLILDLFNPMMNFVDNPYSRGMLALLCISAAGQSITAWKLRQRRNRK